MLGQFHRPSVFKSQLDCLRTTTGLRSARPVERIPEQRLQLLPRASLILVCSMSTLATAWLSPLFIADDRLRFILFRGPDVGFSELSLT